ncbi:MAG: TolC family protein [Chthoniobacterales bacterium]
MSRPAAVAFLLFLGTGSALPALTLEAALARTAERNPAIQQAKLQLEAAAGRRLVLRSTALPDLRVLVPGGVQGGQRAGENKVQPFVFGRGSLTQPLFQAAIPASYRRGDLELLIAQQRFNVAMTEQLHAARIAYLTAAYQDSLRTVAEEQEQRLAGNARAEAQRYEAGKANRGAVTVARLLQQELKPRIEESRRISNGALLQLAQGMADELGPGGKLPAVETALLWHDAPGDVEAQAPAAVANRPDLQLARLLVRAAGEDQRIIEAGYFPAINGSLSGDYIPVTEVRRGSEGSGRRADDVISSEIRAGLTYTWRVVDNGTVRGAALRQRAAREINEVVLARLEAEVPRELARIQNNLEALSARKQALERASTVAEHTVGDVLNNLHEGLASQLEYRTAESSFLQTKGNLLTTTYEQNLALANLDRVTGRYLEFSHDTR